MTVVPLAGRCALPTEHEFSRNLIGGRWAFPAAPYEYEIRSPADSAVTATVPLSSRFDVARAVSTATDATHGAWAISYQRSELLVNLLTELRRLAPDLAALQALETGLSGPDSLEAVLQGLRLADAMLTGAATQDRDQSVRGATGHVLSWGLPFLEVMASCMPELSVGNAVVIKPSLLAPLTAVAFAHVAEQVGLPAGVVNVVQGTGPDVGAALISSPDLVSLRVRASGPVRAAARRGATVTGVRCRDVGVGTNVAVVGRSADASAVASTVADAIRVHSAGGPLALPLVLVQQHRQAELVEAIVAAVRTVVPAPLPSSALRERTRLRTDGLVQRGGALAFSADVPDDVPHRMGWRTPPSVVLLPHPTASSLARGEDPVGPVVEIAGWQDSGDLPAAVCTAARRDGVVSFWGMPPTPPKELMMPMTQEQTPLAALRAGVLPLSWRELKDGAS